MKTLTRILCVLILIITLGGNQAGVYAAPVAIVNWQSRVEPLVLQSVAAGPTEFIVMLHEQADLSAAANLPDKASKGAYVYEQLTRTARDSQRPLLQSLGRAQSAESGDTGSIAYRSYWVANMIWVRGDAALLENLAKMDEVARIYANPWVKLQEALKLPQQSTLLPGAPAAVEWNIQKVNAPQVWALGYIGQGAVIGGQDTGYDWDHPALKDKYRGWDGSLADHNYNWHDAIHGDNPQTSPGNPCGFDSPQPCDDGNHGTHTMGTMVGADGSNQTGMAPGARWIGCRNMEQGWGTPITYAECYQWFIAPTDLNGLNPRPDLAPDVINNSWSCTPAEGCPSNEPDILRLAVENLRLAGILSVHSAGNYGPYCSTVREPAATYDASFSVGATDSADGIAGFSSRGPVTLDGSNRLKPDISAPGVSIRSSVPGTGYGVLGGTSMAGPHVAGLTALLISAQPALSGRPALIEDIIRFSAVPRTTSENCGGVPGSQVPNNTFGWGRIDALAAIQNTPPILLDVKKSVAASHVFTGQPVQFTLAVTNTHPVSITHNVILSDVLPTGASLISATLPYTLTGNLLEWEFASLGPGQSTAVELVVGSQAGGRDTLTNQAYGARSAESPPVRRTIPDAIPVQVDLYPLMVDLRAGTGVFIPGDNILYTLTLTNSHPLSFTYGVILTNTLPVSTSLVSAAPAYTLLGDLLRWDFPSLGPGQAQTATLLVQTDPNANAPVVNADYGADSQEAASASGPPIALDPGWLHFIALLFRQSEIPLLP